MVINVLAFGQIADITGKSVWTIEGVTDTAELRNMLLNEYSGIGGIPYLLAVNKTLVQENTSLHAGDTVALMPPFSGG